MSRRFRKGKGAGHAARMTALHPSTLLRRNLERVAQLEMEARLRRKRDVALARVGGARGAGSAAGQGSDPSAFSAARNSSDNGAESGSASAADNGALAATLTGLLELGSFN